MFGLSQETLMKKFVILKAGVMDLVLKLSENENDPHSSTASKKRVQAQKNFVPKDNSISLNEGKTQSLKDSQGTPEFSGTSYNGPGKVRHEKTDTNKLQRNYRNHPKK